MDILINPQHQHNLPVSAFGMVLGLAGLANCWAAAAHLWRFDNLAANALHGVAALTWLALVLLYAIKYRTHRDDVEAEWNHPILCCFFSLIPVSTMLVGMSAQPWLPTLGKVMIYAGAVVQLSFSAYRSSSFLGGRRRMADTTAIMYLPTVAGNFVSAIALSAIGHANIGKIFFGAGVFAWLSLESIILQRVYFSTEAEPQIWPTHGILLAPPAVGAVAYFAIGGAHADWLMFALLGYAILLLLFLARMIPSFMQTGFTPAYWSFSFGLTALALGWLKVAGVDADPVYTWLAGWFFTLANVALAMLAYKTLRLFAGGKLFVRA